MSCRSCDFLTKIGLSCMAQIKLLKWKITMWKQLSDNKYSFWNGILAVKFLPCKQRAICNDSFLPSTVRVLLCVSAVFLIIQALIIKLIPFPEFIRLPICACLHLFRINSDRPRHLHDKLHVGAERQQANWVVVYTRSASLSRNLSPALT